MTPVGCGVGLPITGQLTLEGIPVLGLVDTGASVTCLGFSVWWRYCARADGVSSCPCCHTSRDSGGCSTAPYRLAACDSQYSPASSRSATTARYRATAPLPTWQPDVSRLWGRRPLFLSSMPTARQKASSLLPMQRGGPLCLSLPCPLLAAVLITAASPRNRPWPS